ncbi:hypothetical protein DLAC_06973 [Tieghemostelium lacteum]|uniref:Pseudouridine synthase RsuA/RluA-like domain-containing protein n=1 Tax=Tieghemostelium lacteum TaxID=361077 RepID=A0A151ZDU1_TIELA|nr:hypothetical protein DLAC_06973 [Tieghemostelium lacteum]|eukprot:KYQ92132.1 hypothetical protein DLAC_06973 [Tieghemostelium lacteum]
MVLLEVRVPKKHVPEKFDKYIAGTKLNIVGVEDSIKLTRSSVNKLYTQNAVKINGQLLKERKTKVKGDDLVQITIENLESFLSGKSQPSQSNQELVGNSDVKLNVLFQDEHLLVVNKDAGMLVHPANLKESSVVLDQKNQNATLVNGLISLVGRENLSDLAGLDRLGIVHRLDKDTSGLMIIAKNNQAHQSLQNLFESHTKSMIDLVSKVVDGSDPITKTQALLTKFSKLKVNNTIQKRYYCMVIGKPKYDHGIITKPIKRHPMDKNKMIIDEKNGKESITEYRLIKTWTRVEIDIYDQPKDNKSKDESEDESSEDEYNYIISKMKKQTTFTPNKSQKKPTSKFLSIESDEDEEDDEDEEEEEEESDEESEEEYDSEDEDDESEDNEEDDYEEKEEDNRDKLKTKKSGPMTFSLVEITLHTGRTHQIRVHMSSEGCAIVGDPIYSSKFNPFFTSHLLLSAMNIQFSHPVDKSKQEFSIGFPKHFKEFIDVLDRESQQQSPNSTQRHINTSSFTIQSMEYLSNPVTNTASPTPSPIKPAAVLSKPQPKPSSNVNSSKKVSTEKSNNNNNKNQTTTTNNNTNNKKKQSSAMDKEAEFDQMFFSSSAKKR